MSTLETADQTRSGSGKAYGLTRWPLVRIEVQDSVYVGRVFVPDTKRRLSDVLCDDRPFLNVIDVSVNGSENIEPYVAIHKQHVRTIRVLAETGTRT